MTRQYHVGIMPKAWERDSQGRLCGKLIIEACRDIDYLSCELMAYLGVRETTKAQLRQNRQGIMAMVNEQYNAAFTSVEVW